MNFLEGLLKIQAFMFIVSLLINYDGKHSFPRHADETVKRASV